MLFGLIKSKKEKIDEPEPKKIGPVIDPRIEELQKKFKIGDKFTYLGVDCVVTNTVRAQFVNIVFGVVKYEWAELSADYVDKNGVIRQLKLSFDEAMAVI